MRNIGLFIIGLSIGAGSIFGYIRLTTRSPQKPLKTVKQVSTFSTDAAPSQSLKGTIASRSGTLFWESRIATEPAQLNDTVQIQQGERLITKDKSDASIHFDKVGTMILSENADVSFVQTLPIDCVIEQKKGTVTYKTEEGIPLSVRIRSAIITNISGTVQITVADGDPIILISTIKGTTQIGFNDLDYISHVFTLREGQIYEYNSDERTTINSVNK